MSQTITIVKRENHSDLVVTIELRHDKRHGDSNERESQESQGCSDELASCGYWGYIPVPYCGYCDRSWGCVQG